jgi:hypothetical protein
MVLFSLMCLLTIPAAARDERPDLNSFTDAQRLEMCQLLDEWITYELYYTFHHLAFAEIHGPNAFFSWHREQLQDLELFLTRKGKTEYVPFPQWNPIDETQTPHVANVVPSYFNGFEPDGITPFDNHDAECSTCSSKHQDYRNFNSNGNFDPYIPVPANIGADICTSSDDVGGFRSKVNFYHIAGHGGFPIHMRSTPNNASAFLFWAYHAHIDEFWRDWDICGLITTSTKSGYDLANGITITAAASPVIWELNGNVKKIQGQIIIEENAELIIRNSQIVEFLDDYFTDNRGNGIIVNKGTLGNNGGKLTIENGAVLRGINEMGYSTSGVRMATPPGGNNVYPLNKAYYNSKWPGIKVYGDATNSNTNAMEHGRVIIDGSQSEVLLDYAETAIESIEGGIIQAKAARFKNCETAIYIHSYSGTISRWNVLRHQFENCIFERTDQVTRYFTNDNFYLGKRDFRDVNFIKLVGVEGIHFTACTFRNTDPNVFSHNTENNRGTGVYAVNSEVYFHKDGNSTKDELTNCPVYDGSNKCSFEGLSYGIRALTENVLIGAWDGHVEAQEVEFTDCFVAADIQQSEDAKFYDCTFSYNTANALFNAATTNKPQRFVYCKDNLRAVVHGKKTEDPPGSKIFIYNSTLTTNSPIATLVEMDGGTSNYFNRVIANQLQNSSPSPESYGVLTRKDNSNSEITCNSFEGFTGAIYNFGNLKDQLGDPNNEFMDPPQAMEVHLRTNGASVTGFTYNYFPSITAPNLDVSSNVFVNPLSSSGETRCELTCRGEHVGVDETALITDAFIYPNPNSGIFTLNIGSNMNLTDVTVNVTDQFGRVVFETVPTSYNQQIHLVQPAGVYIVRIKEHKTLKSRTKLIITKQ